MHFLIDVLFITCRGGRGGDKHSVQPYAIGIIVSDITVAGIVSDAFNVSLRDHYIWACVIAKLHPCARQTRTTASTTAHV